MYQMGNRPNWRRCQVQTWAGFPVRLFNGTWGGKKRLAFAAGKFILASCISAFLLHSGSWAAETPKNLIYHPAAAFKIPFDVDPQDINILKSIELYVSEDKGVTWRLSTSTNATSKAFPFRGNGDGEYWFAVRTLDVQGRYNPSDDKPIVPDWRVVVDTQKPTLALVGVARRGSTAVIKWDARDENLDLGTLVLEYSVSGSGQWRPIPIGKPVFQGEATWDTGTAAAILIRATVADKATNVQHAESEMSDGAAQRPVMSPSLSETMEGQAPPPIAQMASAGNRKGILGPHAGGSMTPSSVSDEWIDTPTAYGPENMANATRGSESGRFPNPGPANAAGGNAAERPIAGTGMGDEPRKAPLVNSPKFPLKYSVEDAGPNGPATVELWVTKDNGRNWSRWSEDTDRVSPILVDLGGEGLFGITIVARSLAGQGDEIPRTGTSPDLLVEVDTTPPAMVLNVIKVGVGSQTGKVLISWRADDRNFGNKPISLYYRPETANQWIPIAEGVENTGQYVWTPGPQVPPVFHIKVDARDEAGNQSSVDTTNYEPVLLDRSRPRARIIGLSMSEQNLPSSAARTYKPVNQEPAVNSVANDSPEPPTSTNVNPSQAKPERDRSQPVNAPTQPMEKPKSSISPNQFSAPPAKPETKPDKPAETIEKPEPAKPENKPPAPIESTPPVSIESAPPVKEPAPNQDLNLAPPVIAPEPEKPPTAAPTQVKADTASSEPLLPSIDDIPPPSAITEPPPSLSIMP